MLALVLSLFSGVAFASFTIEAPPIGDKSEASALNKDARDTGNKGRVIRKFREGEGWEYIVRWTFETDEEARAAAGPIAQAIGAPVVIRDADGAVLENAVVREPPAPTKPSRDWLADALEVHGAGIAMLAGSDIVKVVFERSFPDGRRALHTSVRRGTDHYVAIERLAGDIVESRTVAAGEVAWLELDGKKVKQDLQRTRETLESFGLPAVAPMVLELDRVMKDHPELTSLTPKGTATLGDHLCTVAGSPDGSILFAFDKDNVIRRVSVDGEQRSYEYFDYTKIEGVMIPQRIITRVDGKERDTVEIKSIELDVKVPDSSFVAPR